MGEITPFFCPIRVRTPFKHHMTRCPDDLDTLIRTVLLAFSAATITTLLGMPIAFIIRRTRLPGRRLLSLFTLVTIAVPGIILACGYIFAENARVQGANVFHIMVSIIAPLLRSSLTSIWLLVFTGSMFELAASELLYPPGQPTLPVRIVGLFNDFKLGPGMALSMLNIAIVALALILIRVIPWIIGRLTGIAQRRVTVNVDVLTNTATE